MTTTDGDDKGPYCGKCMMGPCAGQLYLHPTKHFSVVWIEGNPLQEIAFKREGHYEFMHGGWYWNGPAYRAEQSRE